MPKAQSKRNTKESTKDQNLGLWVDYELLRRHQGRPPQTVIHHPLSATNNRYLELADLALGSGKSKKRSKGTSAG
jgi:hypothetical protein